MSQFPNYNGPLTGTLRGMLLGTFHGFNRGAMFGASASPHSGRPHR